MSDIRVIRVLVADDTDTDRLILETIVRQEGHEVLSARNGQEAVELYRQEKPDIILLDALMPVLDGFGAARQIRALAGEELVPIVFLTSLTDTESLVQCLEAGGDDFLSKPYNRVILQAKIKAFYRMRVMHSTLQAQRDQIALHNEHFMQEQVVAKQVFDNITRNGCLDSDNLRYYLSPLAVFNGDVMVAAKNPAGNMVVLLGDFTGHGLPAAIGAMPLATTFYDMVGRGFSASDILADINNTLKSILPVGLFCCAIMVEMNCNKPGMKIWNGGLPAAYIQRSDGQLEKIKSTHLPLGVQGSNDFRADFQRYAMAPGDRLYLWSDGIHEKRNTQGKMLGPKRLEAVSRKAEVQTSVFDGILNEVKAFVVERKESDDLSLIELSMKSPAAIDVAPRTSPSVSARLAQWRFLLAIYPPSFATFDPLPLLLNLVLEVPGLRRHSGSLYTIMSELYSNALEHGVLDLDSSIKTEPEGFDRYYQLRQERSAQATEGYVKISLVHETYPDGDHLTIRVQDSGAGFASSFTDTHISDYSGRGLHLVQSLCDNCRVLAPGNIVEAEFSWHADD